MRDSRNSRSFSYLHTPNWIRGRNTVSPILSVLGPGWLQIAATGRNPDATVSVGARWLADRSRHNFFFDMHISVLSAPDESSDEDPRQGF